MIPIAKTIMLMADAPAAKIPIRMNAIPIRIATTEMILIKMSTSI